jgi:hypothetical protein
LLNAVFAVALPNWSEENDSQLVRLLFLSMPRLNVSTAINDRQLAFAELSGPYVTFV